MSHSRNFKSYAELIVDLWCILIKKKKATLAVTTQQGTRSDILPLIRRYQSHSVNILKRINARFATNTIFLDINSFNEKVRAQIFSHKVGS